MTFPADTYSEAVDLTITASNQLHTVINGDSTTEITIEDGSKIPSLKKVQVEHDAEFDAKIATYDAEFDAKIATYDNEFDVHISGMAISNVGTFSAGYTLTNNRQTLAYGNVEYSWSGTFPKVVAAGATPETTGGIGAGAWVDRTQETLSVELSGKIQNYIDYNQSASGAASLGCLGFGKIQNYLDYNQSINLSNVEIIAHRGFGGWYVQNTMLAFTHAVRCGAKSIELDLSVTADGVVYVFHDSILDGLMEGTGTFTALQSSYIDSRKFQALNGSIFYTSEHIPRWVDVLRWAKRNGIKLYAEVKNIRTEADISLLVQPVLDQNMSLQVAFSSFDTARLKAIRALSPRSHLVRNGNGSSYPTVIQQLLDMGGNATLGWEKQSIFDDPNIVTACASAGIGLAPYTVYTKQESTRLLDLGVRRMICDINLGAI